MPQAERHRRIWRRVPQAGRHHRMWRGPSAAGTTSNESAAVFPSRAGTTIEPEVHISFICSQANLKGRSSGGSGSGRGLRIVEPKTDDPESMKSAKDSVAFAFETTLLREASSFRLLQPDGGQVQYMYVHEVLRQQGTLGPPCSPWPGGLR